jgi:hypothetical protein
MTNTPLTETRRAALIAECQAAYARFIAMLDDYTAEQLTAPTDAAGWTAKDHIMHAAVWAGSLLAVVDHQPRWEAAGVPLALWLTIEQTYDQINAHVQQQHAARPLAEVRAAFDTAQQAVMARFAALPLAALMLPYAHYQAHAESQIYPLYRYIYGNTADHYDEHRAYIVALIAGTMAKADVVCDCVHQPPQV